jgi:hypothetical protein
MKVKRRIIYTWGALEVPWEFDSGSELFKMSDDGLSCVLGTLTQDTDPFNPVDDDNGELVIFDNRSGRLGVDGWKQLIRENAGFIVPVNYADYGSSGCRISCDRVLTVKDTKGDKRSGANSYAEKVLDTMGGYYIIPSDATDPQSYAESVMRTQQQYYDGEVYGVCIWTYTRDFKEYDLNGIGVPGKYTEWSEPNRDDECWGFFGYRYAEKELKEQFEATKFPTAQAVNSKQGELSL